MRNIKLTFQYDGTDFLGFQKQRIGRTIQGELEKSLSIILKESISIVSAGRTDRGVHAMMQVSNFFTKSLIPTEKLILALNNILPPDIFITDSCDVPVSFSARFSAKERVYKYYLTWKQSPFSNRYATLVKNRINLNKFLSILKPLEGEHNFKNFKLADCTSKHQIREIYSITGEQHDFETICITVRGNAFLKSQIRIIIGTALDIYFEKKSSNYFIMMLTDYKTEFLKVVAPPNGLFLSEIQYFENINYSKKID